MFSSLSKPSLYRSYRNIKKFNLNQSKLFKYSSITSKSFYIFDLEKIQRRRNQAGKRNLRELEYLNDEIATNLVDRSEFIMREFRNVAEFGCGSGNILSYLRQREFEEIINDRFKINDYFVVDESLEHLENIQKQFKGLKTHPFNIHSILGSYQQLPFQNNKMDLVIGNQGMHWLNQPQEFLNTMFNLLKPDGVFIGAFFGGDTLHELRSSFIFAEQEREGGVSPHISPFLNVRDVGDMMARIGFSLPTIDVDEITVYYPDAFTLMHHLQMMGESSSLLDSREMVSRESFYAAAAIYESLYYDEEKGGIPATFQIIYAIGWRPHPNQPQPKRRGSATVSMKEIAQGVGSKVGIITESDDGSVTVNDDANEKVNMEEAKKKNAGEVDKDDEEIIRPKKSIPYL